MKKELELTGRQREVILSMRHGAELQKGSLMGAWHLGGDVIRSSHLIGLLNDGLIEMKHKDKYQLTELGKSIEITLPNTQKD